MFYDVMVYDIIRSFFFFRNKGILYNINKVYYCFFLNVYLMFYLKYFNCNVLIYKELYVFYIVYIYMYEYIIYIYNYEQCLLNDVKGN